MPERASKRRPARMAMTWSLGARYFPAVWACAGAASNPANAARKRNPRFDGHFMQSSVASARTQAWAQAFYRKLRATEQHNAGAALKSPSRLRASAALRERLGGILLPPAAKSD